MRSKRRTVVFIGRILWGGGTEMVARTLVHRLDPAKYAPVMIHMFEQRDLPVDFAPHIDIRCLHLPQDPGIPFGVPTHAPPPTASPQPAPSPNAGSRLKQLAKRVPGVVSAREQLRSLVHRKLQPADGQAHRQAVINEIFSLDRSSLALSKALEDIDPDAVLVPMMEESTILAWLGQAERPMPYIASLHTVESIQLSLMYPDPIRHAAQSWMFRSACAASARVTVPTQGVGEDLTESFSINPDHVEVLPNPIELDAIREKAAGPRPDDLPGDGRFTIVHLARLSHEKNHELMIEAAARLARKTQGFRIVCVGEGDRRELITGLIRKRKLEGVVELLGNRENPFPYLKAADASLLTSNYESFAMVLAEALAVGTVPVAVDCPVGPRSVLDGGRYGVLTPDKDPDALAEALHNLMQEPSRLETLRTRTDEGAARFAAETVADRLAEIIDDAARSPRAAPARAPTHSAC